MTTPPRARRPSAQLTWWAVTLAAVTLLAFAGGQWAADATLAPRPSAPPAPATAPEAPAEDRPARPSPPPVRGAEPLVGEDRPAARPATTAGRPSPALVARVTEEASLGLERARSELRARCVPPGRAPDQGAPARFTFSLTFDASGREIARGISEDRRARDPEVAGCLRRLPIGSLRVTAPGANVGVRVALSLP